MPPSIHARLLQMQGVGKTDSAEDMHGHVPPRKTKQRPAGAELPPDSPREAHGDLHDKAAAAKTGGDDGGAKAAATPAPPPPLSARDKLNFAKVDLLARQRTLTSQLATAKRLAAHAAEQLESRPELIRTLHIDAQAANARAKDSWRRPALPGPEALTDSLRGHFDAPVQSFAQRLSQVSLHLKDVDGLLGLHDHELGDLATTHRALPERLSQVERQLNDDQDAMVVASMRGDNHKQLTARVFAGRQEFHRLSEASQALKGLHRLIDS